MNAQTPFVTPYEVAQQILEKPFANWRGRACKYENAIRIAMLKAIRGDDQSQLALPDTEVRGTPSNTSRDEEAFAFIRANPGVEAGEIREHLGLSGEKRNQVATMLARFTRNEQVTFTVRKCGGRAYREYSVADHV